MSYHLHEPRRISRRAAPQRVQVPTYSLAPYENLLPLSAAEPPQSGLTPTAKKVIAIIVVVLLVLALLWWLDQREKREVKPNRSPIRKQSTAAMAKSLYERLQDRGGVDETTMRSLAQLSRNA